MPRTKKGSLPAYRKHKQSGQAITTLPDGKGGRKDYLLGPHDTPESRQAYLRLITEWQSKQALPSQTPAPPANHNDLTVNELTVRFLNHVDEYYRHKDGTPTTEARDFKLSLRPLVHLYGSSPAGQFDSLHLQTVRRLLLDGYDHPRHGKQPALCRSVINQRIDRIKRMFCWADSQKLVPTSVYQNLLSVKGLKQGRSKARDTEPVEPVAIATVAATLPKLSRHVAAMVKIELLTGCRPAEVCSLRGCELDTSAAVWVFRPRQHKTAWKNKRRTIYIGPEAQEVLRPFLKADPLAYIFSPKESRDEWCRLRRQHRKTKLQLSQAARTRKMNPKRAPGDRYTTAAYGKAIRRAALRAGQKPWHPNQLRHTRGTEIANKHSLEVAQAILGHASIKTTEIYALPNNPAAEQLMSKIG